VLNGFITLKGSRNFEIDAKPGGGERSRAIGFSVTPRSRPATPGNWQMKLRPKRTKGEPNPEHTLAGRIWRLLFAVFFEKLENSSKPQECSGVFRAEFRWRLVLTDGF
jgi:hypothetical protein